ncbi:MAG TPA: phytoene/squalene synthase family protein [Actinomycetes bacterium]|nr:phytoene/squalene synthase family protein [Actinomycetes bacterium]
MSRRELDAAGIREPSLRDAYEQCRRLNSSHGRTYYLSTLLLPPHKRPHVHALYGFARYADELVDDLDSPDPDALVDWGDRFLKDLAAGDSSDPVSRAAIHTAHTWDIPSHTFEAFLESMRMDITVTGYDTYADLERYMYGSAAVIGLQMVPILEPLDDRAAAHARVLGEAFQLSNFIRDVAEDLRRGRVYLPQQDLDRFGVSRADLAPGPTPPHVVDLLRFEIDRNRRLYAEARPGIAMLHPTSRDCIETAFRLYGGILDAVERADHQVLDRRVSVPVSRRLRVAVPALVRARRAR